MGLTKLSILFALTAVSSMAKAQTNVLAFDFESPLNLKDWWVDNKEIIVSQCDRKECEQVPGSEKCLRIRWDHVPADKSNTWLTDIKIDEFGSKNGNGTWSNFKENAWLSFQINTGEADSVYLQFIVFTENEKDKWGSHEMIGFKNGVWSTVRVKLSALQYENWGKGNIATPDFNSIVPSRIEIGIRSPKAHKQAKIDSRIDDIRFTNYEP
jgi:hypothetical protein